MPNFNKHLIVLGSARSGTSWLSENLSKPFRYRMLFEPEHPDRTKNGKLIADQWFTSQKPASNPAKKYLTKVFNNRVDSDWIAQNSNRKYKRHLWPFIPKQFVIKFIRMNLALTYLSETFKIPIVFVIRHPFEVIASQKRVNFPWLRDFSFFLKQPELVAFIAKQFNYDLTEIQNKSYIEQLTVRWCIENVIPLQYQELPKHNFYVLKHEDLREDIQIYKKLCEDLNLDILPTIDEEYKKPSTKTHPKSKVRGSEDKRQLITSEEKAEIIEVLHQFKQELYEV